MTDPSKKRRSTRTNRQPKKQSKTQAKTQVKTEAKLPVRKKAVSKPRVAISLDGKQRRYLRGLAHDLQPVLQIGKSGASKALLDELDRVLETHELVKVRFLRECPTDLDELLPLVEKNLGASAVGSVGRIAILYRAHKQAPKIKLPKAKQRAPEPDSDSEQESELESE